MLLISECKPAVSVFNERSMRLCYRSEGIQVNIALSVSAAFHRNTEINLQESPLIRRSTNSVDSAGMRHYAAVDVFDSDEDNVADVGDVNSKSTDKV